MSDGSGFQGFHSHSYDRDYARPLFRVASFSDSGDEQENHVSSPQVRSHSTSRTASSKAVAPSRLSLSVSRPSMKKMQQVIDEKSMEEEGNGWQTCLVDVLCGVFWFLMMASLLFQRWS